MYDGKKSVAEKIVYSAFDIIKEKQNLEPTKVFHDAIVKSISHPTGSRSIHKVL